MGKIIEPDGSWLIGLMLNFPATAAALNNNLNGCSLEQEGNDFYIVGADSVRKKLGSMDFVLSSTLTPEWTDGNGIRNTVQVKINYTYKNGVLSHSITGLVSAAKCSVSKSIAIT